jgi:hypothetical protein
MAHCPYLWARLSCANFAKTHIIMPGAINSQEMRLVVLVTGKQNDDQNINLPALGTIPLSKQVVTLAVSPANVTVTQDAGNAKFLNLSSTNYDPQYVKENMYFYNNATGGTPSRAIIRKIKKIHNMGRIELFDAIPSDITITAQPLLLAPQGLYRMVQIEATKTASTGRINGVPVKSGDIKVITNVAAVECFCYQADGSNEEFTFILGQ